jgi:hypothetical protein
MQLIISSLLLLKTYRNPKMGHIFRNGILIFWISFKKQQLWKLINISIRIYFFVSQYFKYNILFYSLVSKKNGCISLI